MARKIISILLCLLVTGCSIYTEKDFQQWDKGKKFQQAGQDQEAVSELYKVLNRHKGQSEEELLPLRLDTARSLFQLKRLSETENILAPVVNNPNLSEEQKDEILYMSGWTALIKIRERPITEEAKAKQINIARKNFHYLLNDKPKSYKAKLGYALALYEASKLLNTKTHLNHAHELLRECAVIKPGDPVLKFAFARVKQRLLGNTNLTALRLLKDAFVSDRKTLEVKAAYKEIFEEISEYQDVVALKNKVPDPEKRSLIKLYLFELEKCCKEPAATGLFWENVKSFISHYHKSFEIEKHFQEGIAEAKRFLLAPDYSPLTAAQKSLNKLQETKNIAAATPELLKTGEYKKTKLEVINSLLTALEQKITTNISIERFDSAEQHLSQAFDLINTEQVPNDLNWARKFQKLRQKLTCRKDFSREKNLLRHNLQGKTQKAVRSELSRLKNQFQLCTIDRDFQELADELLASQSVSFQMAMSDAKKAALQNDLAGERKQLEKALAMTSLKEFSHRQNEILLLLATSYFNEGFWEKTIEQINKIPIDNRRPSTWLLLGSAFACEEKYDKAFSIFSQKKVSDELSSDVRFAAAAGLTFSSKGDHSRALPLLNEGLQTANLKLPFSRDKLLTAMYNSLAKVLNKNMSASREEIHLAKGLISSGRGDARLSEALGNYFIRVKNWKEAYFYLQKAKEWGIKISSDLLSRLQAFNSNYAPLQENLSWQYLQGNGQLLNLKITKDLGNGRFRVSFQIGTAHDSWEWMEKGKNLYKYFGKDLKNCHIMPVGLTTPITAIPFPSAKYTINGKKWISKITGFGKTVETRCKTFKNCLVVETIQPGKKEAVRHYFAPGIGEVKVEYPTNQKSMNLTLVNYIKGRDK